MTVPPDNVNQQTPDSEQPRMIQVKLPGSVKTPWATYILIGVTVVVYLLQMLSQSLLGGDLVAYLGEKINAQILNGEVWRLLTPVFLHGSILHIVFNMYALFAIGPSLERAYGHKRFLLLYFLAGFAGNTLSFLLSPAASLGASTAIFGLIAAEVIYIYRNKKIFGGRARGILLNLGMIIVVNLLLGLSPGIDNFGHVGGLIGGAIFAWIAGPVYELGVGETGYELQDKHTGITVVEGVIVTFGIFAAVVIGRMLAG